MLTCGINNNPSMAVGTANFAAALTKHSAVYAVVPKRIYLNIVRETHAKCILRLNPFSAAVHGDAPRITMQVNIINKPKHTTN